METRPLRRLNVDMESLAVALDGGSWDVLTYLDLESGEIISIAAEVWQKLEELTHDVPVDQGADEMGAAALEATLADADLLSWMREALLDAYAVQHERGTRYVEVPRGGSAEVYGDMVRFIETVSNARVQLRLQVAIRGAGAFARFTEVLAGDPEERERWLRFKEDRLRERVLEWLIAQGIEPIPDG
jgi:hypothetical protein